MFQSEVASEAAAEAQAGGGAWRQRLLRALCGDIGFYAVILATAASAQVLSAVYHRHMLEQVASAYLNVWLNFGGMAIAVMTAFAVVQPIWRQRPARPLVFAADALKRFASPERVAGLVLFAALGLFMVSFIAIKCLLPRVNPFWADPMLADVSRALSLGQDDWRWLQPLLGDHGVTRMIELAYVPGWMAVTSVAVLYFCIAARDPWLRRRFVSVYLAAWVINGLIVACAFMSAGPAFYAAVTGDPERFRGLVSYLAHNAQDPISAAARQAWMLAELRNNNPNAGVGISAFPSMHVSMATLVALAAWRINAVAGTLLTAFAGLILAGSVHLAWHYAVDGYFAIASVALMWWIAGRLHGRRTGSAQIAPVASA